MDAVSGQRGYRLCLSWVLDAFDFFVLVFILSDMAKAFDSSVQTLPGFVYQIGNFVAVAAGPLQTSIDASHGGNYSLALLSVAAVVAVIIAICALLGRESRNTEFTTAAV